ncbi:hypothetical protein C3V36_09910 [Lachnospiraceae bacterium oral taxon 500]|nr:hypothetical protein C3V36_09910 [Lachnospiraceae bacterium oral taxon 500]
MHSRKFYKKLFLTYMGIVCAYTLIIIGLFFMGAKKYIGKRADIQNELFLQQYAKAADTALETAFNVSRQIFTSSEMKTFLLAKEVDYYNLTMLYTNIQRTLSPFSRLNFFLAMGKSNSDIIITANGTLNKEKFYRKMAFPFSGDADWKEYFSGQNSLRPVLVGDGSFYNVSGQIVTIMEAQRLLGNIEMLSYFSYPEKELFPDINEWGSGGLIVSSGGRTLLARNYGIAEEQWQVLLKQLYDEESSGLIPDGYMLYQYPLGEGGLELYYIAKAPGFGEMWAEIMMEFGWIYLALICFGAIGAYLISRRIYRPFLSVVNQFQEDYHVSGSDEFALIRTASEKMNRTKQELEKIIRENTKPLKMKFLRDLFYGLSDENDIEEKTAKYGLGDFEGPFCLILAEHINYTQMGEQFSEQNLGKIWRRITTLYVEALSRRGGRCEMIELEKKRLALLFPERDYAERKADIEELLDSLGKDYGVQVLAVLGKPAAALRDLEESYSSAIEALNYRSLLPKNRLTSYEQSLAVKPITYYYPLDVEESLMNYVEQRKEEETHLLLEHILNQNFKRHEMNAENISLLTFAIIATINRLLNQQLKTAEDVYGEGTILYLELKTPAGEAEFRAKVHNLFQTLLEKSEDENPVYQEDRLALRLLEYIHANYQTDISLNDVAEAFSITPTYVSMLFKKEYKTNFKDYLNRYKIEQAKEIMKKNPTIKNKELSEAVGFNSVNTFLRLFKKYTGETPGRYLESKHSG